MSAARRIGADLRAAHASLAVRLVGKLDTPIGYLIPSWGMPSRRKKRV